MVRSMLARRAAFDMFPPARTTSRCRYSFSKCATSLSLAVWYASFMNAAVERPPASEGGLPLGIMNDAYHIAKDKLVAHFETEYLTRLVARAGGNMSKAARLASIDRTTLYRLMEKHGFRRDEFSGTIE